MYCPIILSAFTALPPPTQICINIGTVVGIVVARVVVIIIMGVVIGALVARNRRYKLSVQQHAMYVHILGRFRSLLKGCNPAHC